MRALLLPRAGNGAISLLGLLAVAGLLGACDAMPQKVQVDFANAPAAPVAAAPPASQAFPICFFNRSEAYASSPIASLSLNRSGSATTLEIPSNAASSCRPVIASQVQEH